jgi:hypothetical protein
MNPKLNIAEIVQTFPSQVVGTHGRPVFNLFTPFDVALRENQLRVVRAELDLGPTIPAHYFVYAQGEPATRAQTKIGGLPYRPRDLEWPRDANGKPKEFVGQVDFTDSRSLLPSLPGDVVLLFASEQGIDDQPFKLEWHPSGIRDLMQPGDLPKFDFMFPMVQVPVHCHLYETHDYPEATARLKGTKFEKWTTLGTPCGSKIAGFHKAATAENCHVLTLEAIQLAASAPYPFVNRKDWEPDSIAGWFADKLLGAVRRLSRLPARPNIYNVLMIGDLGSISIFKEANGQFLVTDESH